MKPLLKRLPDSLPQEQGKCLHMLIKGNAIKLVHRITIHDIYQLAVKSEGCEGGESEVRT